MATPNKPLPPDIPGTTADDDVYRIREGEVPMLKARYPLYILGAGAIMACLSMLVAGLMTRGAAKLPPEEQQSRYVHALAVAAIGGGASATLLGIGSTALQIGGERSDSLAAHAYPARLPALPMSQQGDRWEMDPYHQATEQAMEPTEQPREEYRGFLQGVELPGEKNDYEARLAEVNIDRIQADVANILDGFKKNDCRLRKGSDPGS